MFQSDLQRDLQRLDRLAVLEANLPEEGAEEADGGPAGKPKQAGGGEGDGEEEDEDDEDKEEDEEEEDEEGDYYQVNLEGRGYLILHTAIKENKEL